MLLGMEPDRAESRPEVIMYAVPVTRQPRQPVTIPHIADEGVEEEYTAFPLPHDGVALYKSRRSFLAGRAPLQFAAMSAEQMGGGSVPISWACPWSETEPCPEDAVAIRRDAGALMWSEVGVPLADGQDYVARLAAIDSALNAPALRAFVARDIRARLTSFREQVAPLARRQRRIAEYAAQRPATDEAALSARAERAVRIEAGRAIYLSAAYERLAGMEMDGYRRASRGDYVDADDDASRASDETCLRLAAEVSLDPAVVEARMCLERKWAARAIRAWEDRAPNA